MNRIIYLSLNYEIQKIEILKEILEKLNKNPLKKFSTPSFLHQMVLDIQLQLASIEKNIRWIAHVKPRRFLRIITIHRKEFKDKTKLCEKTLTATIEACNRNFLDIKTNVKNLEDHFMKECLDFIP